MQKRSVFLASHFFKKSNLSSFNVSKCFYSTPNIPKEATAVVFHKYGQPQQVLKVEKVPLPQSLGPNDVYVKMLAAPINPADFNTVEGNYGKLPQLPSIVGSEGVGFVEAVGPNVKDLKPDDLVIPSNPGFGTWRTDVIADQNQFQTVSKDIPVEYAATIGVNPCTAYRMLHDFVNLQPGDVIVQNGANSMVGHAVIQIAKAKGIKTINLIRERPDLDDTVERLKHLGGDIVVTDRYANTAAMRTLISDLPKAKLALNCVGGAPAKTVAGLLGEGGVMVTYGGMSRMPITMATGPFIFKDISLRGFWMSRWVEKNPKEKRQQMLDELSDLIKNKELVLFMKTFKFSDFGNALEESLNPIPKERRKIVLEMQK